MTREQAIPYIGHCVDDALSEHELKDMPANARLVGWQCGFEPMFVAVWSYLFENEDHPDFRLDDEAAVEIAIDLLAEKNWFSGESREPDYII